MKSFKEFMREEDLRPLIKQAKNGTVEQMLELARKYLPDRNFPEVEKWYMKAIEKSGKRDNRASYEFALLTYHQYYNFKGKTGPFEHFRRVAWNEPVNSDLFKHSVEYLAKMMGWSYEQMKADILDDRKHNAKNIKWMRNRYGKQYKKGK